MKIFRTLLPSIALASLISSTAVWSDPIPADYGQTHKLVVALPFALTSLDPGAGGNLRADLSVISSIYSPLTRIDANGTLVGVLARSWEQTSERSWKFVLRDDVRYSDGSAFNAEVVKWNVERLLNVPKANYIANAVKAVEKIDIIGANEIEFTLKAPDVDFPKRLTGVFYLEPNWAATHNPAIEAMGTGPYKLVSFNPEEGVELVANEAHFDTAPPFANAKVQVVTDAAAKLNGIRTGEIDAAAVIAPQDLVQLQSVDGIVAGAIPSQRVQIIRFNTNIKPLEDARVRQALNYAIDKEAITKALFGGVVEPAKSQIITTFHEGFNTELAAWPYDIEKAKSLLAEAGYADGFEVEMVFGKGSYVGGEQAAQIIASQLAQIGVKVQLSILPNSVHSERAASEKAAGLTWFGYADTASIASETLSYLGSGHFHTIGPIPSAYDAAITRARTSSNKDDSLAAVKEATAIAAEEALAVFLWELPQTYAHSDKVIWDIRRDDWTRLVDIRPNIAPSN